MTKRKRNEEGRSERRSEKRPRIKSSLQHTSGLVTQSSKPIAVQIEPVSSHLPIKSSAAAHGRRQQAKEAPEHQKAINRRAQPEISQKLETLNNGPERSYTHEIKKKRGHKKAKLQYQVQAQDTQPSEEHIRTEQTQFGNSNTEGKRSRKEHQNSRQVEKGSSRSKNETPQKIETTATQTPLGLEDEKAIPKKRKRERHHPNVKDQRPSDLGIQLSIATEQSPQIDDLQPSTVERISQEGFREQSGIAQEQSKKRKEKKVDPAYTTAETLVNEQVITRKPRRKKREGHSGHQTGDSEIQNRPIQHNRQKKKRELSEKHGHGQENANPAEDSRLSWQVSDAVGGQMLDIDPIFSPDEQHLIIAFDTVVNIYSTPTSLLLRSLHIDRSDHISALSLSDTDSRYIYVSAASGVIHAWDWLDGFQLGFWHIKSKIHSMVTTAPNKENLDRGLIYTADQNDGGQWMINAFRFLSGENAGKVEAITLRNLNQPLRLLRVFENGRLLVAACGSDLMLGTTDRPDPLSLTTLTYVWRDVQCPELISSLDVRVTDREVESELSTRDEAVDNRVVDLVVGGIQGSIFVYQDLLGQLVQKESNSDPKSIGDLDSRKLHWHRNAVLSVKWSLDGNYIVSGGLENTLLLWQLETGSKETLPHLGAPVEGIVVSPSGSLYALRLADNSAMILSTSELKPTFSVAGIQIPAARDRSLQLPHMPTVDAPSKDLIERREAPFPATFSPQGLLLAVPSATASRMTSGLSSSASYLQTFDIKSSHQLLRQALTRNKITDLNMGPESNTIKEPNVVHMQISHNGQWLVTVDEWMPPKRDMAAITFNDEREVEEQESRREVFLKFWVWNETFRTWELVSRFDNPHTFHTGASNNGVRILDLAASHTSVTFATIGEDRVIRIWRPSVRRRHGSAVRNQKGKELETWNCHISSPLDSSFVQEADYLGAKLVFSPDGSVLAAACGSSLPWKISLIDTHDGSQKPNALGPFQGAVFGLGILDRYLITFTQELCVWDLVTQKLRFALSTRPSHALSTETELAAKHLCVNIHQENFAITLPDSSSSVRPPAKQPKSRFIVFSPKDNSPLFSTLLDNRTTNVLCMKERAGYWIMDSAAEIRRISPIPKVDVVLPPPSPPPPPVKSLGGGFLAVFGRGADVVGIEEEGNQRALMRREEEEEEEEDDDDDDDDEVARAKAEEENDFEEEPDQIVVRPEALTEVFDQGFKTGVGKGMIREMFERVAELFGGRKERE